jgi:hypothetical protein
VKELRLVSDGRDCGVSVTVDAAWRDLVQIDIGQSGCHLAIFHTSVGSIPSVNRVVESGRIADQCGRRLARAHVAPGNCVEQLQVVSLKLRRSIQNGSFQELELDKLRGGSMTYGRNLRMDHTISLHNH